MRDAVQQAKPFVGSVVEDRYRIEEELGAGAMGVVYRGRHVKVGRTVAIKVLHDHLVRNQEMVDRFEREARIAARLRHRNLVAVIDLGVAPDGKKLMVLEFAPGENLAKLVTAPLPRERVIDVTRQLLRGLDHAHALGLVHRDLKPENILVERDEDGREIPRIVDFGIAVLRDQDESIEGRRLTSDGMVLGTPLYMSPEQARGERVDHRTDLFSLGVIVYEMLAGMTPFSGSGVEVMMLNIWQEPPSVATRAGVDVDPLLEAFARKLMARRLRDRFATAHAALDVLELIERDRDAAARALGLEMGVPAVTVEDAAITRRHVIDVEPPVCVIEPPPRRGRWGAIVGAAAVVGIALAIALIMGRASRPRAPIGSPTVELAPSASDVELELEVRGTAMLPSPPPVSSRVVAPEDTTPMTTRVAVAQPVVIARVGEIALVVGRFER